MMTFEFICNARDKARTKRVMAFKDISLLDIFRAGIRVFEDRYNLMPITREEIETYTEI